MTDEATAALDDVFTYHSPTPEQLVAYARIRSAGRAFAEALLESCRPGPDRSRALTFVRDAVMIANASVAVSTASVVTLQRAEVR